MSSAFFIFLAYFIVFITISVFVYNAFRQRKHFLVKLEEEGFLDKNL